ncbi:hypothetical protein L3X38_027994 [Prunus dulcis]|uniref:Uncharacterized protein n=1 Tax=Prunus dulcis TaxID=3755 RepID=A0AAD4Z004_PRUDU|nr:hypothetical protein L3X38_027994 [Prunus dulcis]
MLWGGALEAENGADLGAEFRNVVAEMIELLGKPNVSDFFPSLARFDVQGIARRMKQLQSMTEKIFDSAIERQKSEAVEKLPQGGEELDLSEKFGILMKKKKPLVLIPTPRLSDPALYE